jgi:hypothetical protein
MSKVYIPNQMRLKDLKAFCVSVYNKTRKIVQMIIGLFKRENKDERNNRPRFEVYSLSPEEMIKNRMPLNKKRTKEKEIVEEEEEKPMQHMYYVKNNKLILSINYWVDEIKNNQTYPIKDTGQLEIVINDNTACLMFKVSVLGVKMEIAPSHISSGLGHDKLEKMEQINPMVLCTKRKKKLNRVYQTKANADVSIITITSDLNIKTMIMTKIFQKLDVMLKVKGKPKPATIGIILHIVTDINYIWSGSVVTDDKGCVFVVSSVTKHRDGFNIIVAWAVFEHDIIAVILDEA